MKEDSNQTPEIVVPLGLALKDARKAASLSVEEVALQLNLGGSTVRDLEDDLENVLNTKKYPAIYLRGYLVNYAKLVDLTTLELFVEYQQLQNNHRSDRTLRAPDLILPVPKKRSKLLPFSILFFIALIAIIYFIQQPSTAPFQEITPLSNSEQHVSKNDDNKVVVLKKSEESPAKKNTVIDEMTKPAINVEEEVTPVKAVGDTLIPIVDDIKDVPFEEAMPVESVEPEETPPAIEESTEEVPALEAESSADVTTNELIEEKVVTSPVESLSLTFSDDCWTEVFDATGKRIAFGLYKNGRHLMLSGIAPFQLKLGDPSVVEIQYQDQILEGDFTPGRSAQFSVPSS